MAIAENRKHDFINFPFMVQTPEGLKDASGLAENLSVYL